MAQELTEYWHDSEPSDRAFNIQANRYRVMKMFKQDMDGAKIVHTDKQAGEKVDFHALRSTAITWWFTVYGLSVKEVSELARATPSVVERYSRRFRMDNHAWLAKAPSPIAKDEEDSKEAM